MATLLTRIGGPQSVEERSATATTRSPRHSVRPPIAIARPSFGITSTICSSRSSPPPRRASSVNSVSCCTEQVRRSSCSTGPAQAAVGNDKSRAVPVAVQDSSIASPGHVVFLLALKDVTAGQPTLKLVQRHPAAPSASDAPTTMVGNRPRRADVDVMRSLRVTGWLIPVGRVTNAFAVIKRRHTAKISLRGCEPPSPSPDLQNTAVRPERFLNAPHRFVKNKGGGGGIRSHEGFRPVGFQGLESLPRPTISSDGRSRGHFCSSLIPSDCILFPENWQGCRTGHEGEPALQPPRPRVHQEVCAAVRGTTPL
jgi:hypothetical protein